MDEQPNVLSDSDGMQKVEFYASPFAEVLMSIDSARFTEDVVTLLTFLAILLISLFSGFYGPRPTTTEYAIETFERFSGTVQPRYAYSVINLSSLTRSIQVKLAMDRKPGVEPVKGGVSVLVEGTRQGNSARLASQSFQPMPVDFKNSLNGSQSLPFTVFKDQTVDYSYVSVQISFTSVTEEYTAAKILFQIGNAEFVVYEMIFRLLFSASMIAFLILLVIRLRSTKPKNWHVEQKITIPLLLIIALYNNPLYGLKIVSWSTNYLFDALFRGLMVGYISYFLLVLFDNLRYKNGVPGSVFFIPKMLVSIFLALVVVIYGLLEVYINMEDDKAPTKIRNYLETVKLLIAPSVAIAGSYFAIVIALVFRDVDPTEKYKLNLYVLTVAICFLAGLVGYHVKEDNALIFTIQYAIISLFGILMAYFHWPYEVAKDQTYDEQDHTVLENPAGGGFMVNQSSDN